MFFLGEEEEEEKSKTASNQREDHFAGDGVSKEAFVLSLCSCDWHIYGCLSCERVTQDDISVVNYI